MLHLEKKIATTKMSEVWVGYLNGVKVAVKKPVSNEMLKIIRFVKEAKYWKEISDLNIDGVAKVMGIDQYEPWFAVEFIEGETLDKYLKNADVREIMSRMLEVLRILHHVHKKGYLHLDIKPSNILIDKYGDVVFLDWGLATRIFRKLKDEKYTFIGTPSYAPPELWDPDKYGTPDQRSDVYEVGTTFYKILVKQVPFHKKSEVLSGQIRPFPKNVPRAVQRIILKAINPDMNKRYQSAMEMYRDVQAWLQSEKVLRRGLYKIRFKKSLIISYSNGLSFVADYENGKKNKKLVLGKDPTKNKIAKIVDKRIKAYRDGIFVEFGMKKRVKPSTWAELYHGSKIYYRKEELGKIDFGYRNVVYVDFIAKDVNVARRYFEFINFLKEKNYKLHIKRGKDKINYVAHKVLIRNEVPDEMIDYVVMLGERRFHVRLAKDIPIDTDIQIYGAEDDNIEILKTMLRCEV